MIRFANVSKSYQGREAVNVDLELAKGRVHALIGESGSGKSTLVRLAAGLIDPDHGEITLNGRLINDITDAEKANVFGYMIQGGGLFPHLTCEQNVALPAKVHGVAESVFRRRYKELCAMVGLDGEILRRYPKELSGGQKQRVALVRALILDPPLIFLDEPLGALDPIVRSDLQIELKRIFHDLKKTVVLVTHDLAEAAFLCHSLVLLHNGRVEQQGPLEELLAAPKTAYVRQFLASQRPPPNLQNWRGFSD